MLKETDPAKWARDTGANLLVQPAVRQMGEERQLSFSLTLAGSPVQIAAGEVTGASSEHFRLEEELAQKLVAALNLQLASGAASAPSVPAGASQTDYVVALGYLERYDEPASVQKAVDLLTKIPGGGNSALVQAALSRAYLATYKNTHDIAFARLAQTSAETAQKLDPARFETLLTLGRIKAESGRFDEAIADFQRALARDPSSVEALLYLGDALADSGNRGTRRRPTAGPPRRDRRTGRRTTGSARSSTRAATTRARFRRTRRRRASTRRAPGRSPICAGPTSRRAGSTTPCAPPRSRSSSPRPRADGRISAAPITTRGGTRTPRPRSRKPSRPAQAFRALGGLGDALRWAGGDAARARAAYEEVLRRMGDELSVNPRDAAALRNRAHALANLGEEGKALEAILAARAAAPEDSTVLLKAAMLALRRKDQTAAFALVADAVRKGFSPSLIRADPEFGAVKADPLFEKALATPRSPGAQ